MSWPPRNLHASGTRLFSAIIFLLGVAMIVSTVARGGGPAATGILLGLLFIAAGAGRFWMARDRS